MIKWLEVIDLVEDLGRPSRKWPDDIIDWCGCTLKERLSKKHWTRKYEKELLCSNE